MTQTPGKPTTTGGGGAATSAGIQFQQQVGAIMGAWILAEQSFDRQLELGAAKPEWLRFETEAPVDDILIGTSDGGFVAVQVKTKASLSRDLKSPFGKTISQFVQHWLACHNGNGSLRWNRPLDANSDRLILAVGPQNSFPVREALPAALRLKSQPGGGELNVQQQHAFETFEACVEQAWAGSTALAYDASIARELAALIRVVIFDPTGPYHQAVVTTLARIVPSTTDAAIALSGLEVICGELMTQRGGADLESIRRKLLGRGIPLLPPLNFQHDIERLKAHSSETAKTLERFEVIEAVPGDQITIERECQEQVRDAAKEGSFLIVGEPGAGKSAVLNALARDLRHNDFDVVELAVDRHSVETLEGLRHELSLEHGLIETLKAWDSSEPAWLIIDALDATRGGHGEGVFRALIEQVMALDGRWNVVASIRTFDLRMGKKFRTLFKGKPPIAEMVEPGFSNVRHVRVPPWTRNEFDQLLMRAPALRAALANAPVALKDLAANPFNTRLLSDLVKDGLVTTDLSHVASQSELLQLYWEDRVEHHGAPAQACIRWILESMVEARALRAPFNVATQSDAAVLDELEREGVLISVDNRRWIQFRHHLLFDFAAARILLYPEELIAGRLRFDKGEARGLMLAQALTFVLREIWIREQDHAAFWTAAAHILSDPDGDPVIKSATGRICAEYPSAVCDMSKFADRIVANDKSAVQAFIHTCGALAIRLEDHPETPLTPWVGLVREIASNVTPVAGTLRFLLYRLTDSVERPVQRKDLGTAARALLEYSFTLEQPHNDVSASIHLVSETFESDPDASRKLLEKIFSPERLALHAAEEVPALCREIEKIAPHDPAFAERIYQETYGFELTGDQETMIGNSQIMPLKSNARQDYDMARYALKEFFRTFLQLHPKHAVGAITQAVESYVAKEHTRTPELLDAELEVVGRRVRLREDRSYIWAHSTDGIYGHDAEALVKKLLDYLISANINEAIYIAERLIETSSLAIFWSRLFLAATERDDTLIDTVLPIAMQEDFLMLPDTCKDSVDIVAKGYQRLSQDMRAEFENAVSQFDFSRYQKPDDARVSFERRLFSTIGPSNLVSDYARDAAGVLAGADDVSNDRLFTLSMTAGSPEPYYWIPDLDKEVAANCVLMAAIDETKQRLGNKDDAQRTIIDLEDALDAIETLARTIDHVEQNPHLIVYAEGQISESLVRLVDVKAQPEIKDDALIQRFLKMFTIVANSAGPRIENDTEANFENSVSWGSPAPRVDAAQLSLDMVLLWPNLYSILKPTIDRLLNDPHPAVRLQAILHTLRIWDLDRDSFWRHLSTRLTAESNQGVIDHICTSVLGRVAHKDPEKVEAMALPLLHRFDDDPERQPRMRETLSDLLAILWVTYERQDSQEVVAGWIAESALYRDELSKILGSLRNGLVAGIEHPANIEDKNLRHRAQKLVNDVVIVASHGLEAFLEIDSPSPEQSQKARDYARLLDDACLQLFFAVGAGKNSDNDKNTFSSNAIALYFDEVAEILETLGNYATPHTVYYLLQLFEFLLPANPARAFDLTAHALRSGGNRTGYQFESLGVDLLVKLVGVFLADHKELFDNGTRRAALIDCLEIFMKAGWPSAQRLLYRLPELIQ
ncbi:hypothetical protein [Kushneria sp. TE3]|uniref:hypothetical protein n=1 Tax=Kushneria sp. TE3 TaxID=3449832 RepID=UPI003F683C61